MHVYKELFSKFFFIPTFFLPIRINELQICNRTSEHDTYIARNVMILQLPRNGYHYHLLTCLRMYPRVPSK